MISLELQCIKYIIKIESGYKLAASEIYFLHLNHDFIPYRNRNSFYTSLFKSKINAIDFDTMQLYKKKYIESMFKHFIIKEHLDLLLHEFKNLKYNPIFLKGTAFNSYIYNSKCPRISNDIDILVHTYDWSCCVNLLDSLMLKHSKNSKGVFDDAYELSFLPLSNRNGYPVDLHMSLMHGMFFNLDYDSMWQRSLNHPAYESARIFCIEDNIIHQAIHCFKDLNFISYGLVDTHRLIEQPNFDPAFLLSLAKQSKTDIALHYLFDALSLCSDEHIIKDIRYQTRPTWLRNKLCKWAISLPFTKDDVLTKSTKYRLKQTFFQFCFTRCPLQILKFILDYLTVKIKRQIFN